MYSLSKEDLVRLLAVGRGDEPADLVLAGGRVVDLFGGRIIEANVAVHDGLIVGLGDYEARQVYDISGCFVAPSFIDGHIHLESTLLSPLSFTQAALPWGTGAVVADPHEIANVSGLAGIEYLLQASAGLPLDIFFMAPSCVPASPLATSGARLEAADLAPLADDPRILGLGEVMNFPGLVAGEAGLLEKTVAFEGKVIDGHAPFLSGKGLNAYALAGPGSDHESSTPLEAWQRLETGMRVMIRQGSAAQNLAALLPVVSAANSRRMFFVTDDLHPDELLARGHLNSLLALAVEAGLNPITALQMVSLNPAEYFGLKDRGAVAPGFLADLVVLEDLTSFKPRHIFYRGRLAASGGRLVNGTDLWPKETTQPLPPAAMRVRPYPEADLAIQTPNSQTSIRVRVIGLLPGQLITENLVEEPKVKDGLVAADPQQDLCKLAVIERHKASGNIGLGLVKGFGLKRGALASSVAHDAHNLIGLGTNDGDLYLALRRVEEMGGGLCAVAGSKILAELALPIAGLISPSPPTETAGRFQELTRAAQGLGAAPPDPFMALSFLALEVIPALKLTDRGLVDGEKMEVVGLFVE